MHWHVAQVELPQGLCVLGDAATCFNPIYGQGMTVGIKGAILLRDTLQKRLQGRKFTPAAASSVLSGFSKVSSRNPLLLYALYGARLQCSRGHCAVLVLRQHVCC